MAADLKQPDDWYVGVHVQETINETKLTSLQRGLTKELGAGEEEDGWPWWKHVDDRYINWEAIVPELFKDLHDTKGGEGGEITAYFVELFEGVVNGLDRVTGSIPSWVD